MAVKGGVLTPLMTSVLNETWRKCASYGDLQKLVVSLGQVIWFKRYKFKMSKNIDSLYFWPI